jgi:hypothetical protein
MLIPFIQIDRSDQMNYNNQQPGVLATAIITSPPLDPVDLDGWVRWIRSYKEARKPIKVLNDKGHQIGVATDASNNGDGTISVEIREPDTRYVWGEVTLYNVKDLKDAIAGFCIEELINAKCATVTREVRRQQNYCMAVEKGIYVQVTIPGLED